MSCVYSQTRPMLFSWDTTGRGYKLLPVSQLSLLNWKKECHKLLFIENESFGKKIKERNYEDLFSFYFHSNWLDHDFSGC